MLKRILKLFGGSEPRESDTEVVESGVAFGEDAPASEPPEPRSEPPGDWDIAHYTQASEIVKELKRERRHDEALELLEWCIDETIADVEDPDTFDERPAPWYFEHAAIVYRKENRYADEVEVLERYHDVAGDRAKQKLSERLERARELAAEN